MGGEWVQYSGRGKGRSMNLAPRSFLDICAITDISEDKAQTIWLDIWEKTILEFLTWLVKDVDLSYEQTKKLGDIMSSIVDKTSGDYNILELIAPILREDQTRLVTEKFAQLFTTNLDDFYTDLKNKMTVEQKQVVNSFVKVAYV